MPLAMCQAGSTVRLVTIDSGRELQSRLAAMGLTPGAELEVVSSSLSGPFIVAIKGSRVVLGRGMAHKIMVS